MKIKKCALRWASLLCLTWAMLYTTPTQAYIGLCCGKCGGNMCMNILGAGVPETHEFRFKITPMFMRMDGLRTGTSDVKGSDLLSLPASIYKPVTNSGMMMNMSPMAMPTDASILQDHIYSGATNRKYMAVPSSMGMSMLNFSAGYSFTDDFFGGIMFMSKQNRMDMVFNPSMQYMTGRSGFTMKSEGMADTMLISKYRLYTDDPMIPASQISLVAGLSLPTGSINQKNKSHPLQGNPYALLEPYSNSGTTYPQITMPVFGSSMSMTMPIADRRNELLPYAMQLGSGTYDPVLGLVYSGSTSPFWWGLNVIYKGRWYRNEQDYALGDELNVDLYVMYQLNESMVVHAQLNGISQGDIQGEMIESQSGESGRAVQHHPYSEYSTPLYDPRNYGRDQINFSLGLQWQPVSLQIVDLTFSAPIYERVNGTQMSEEYRVQLAYYVEITTTASRRDPKYKANANQKGQTGF